MRQSLAAAIVWSGSINWFLRSKGLVPLFTRTAMLNYGDLLEKVREVTYPLPGYWVQAMYANQPERIPVAIEAVSPVMEVGGKYFKAASGIPVIDAVALLSADSSALAVILTNRHPDKTILTEVFIDGFKLEDAAGLELLIGAGFWARNYRYAPDVVCPQYEQILRNGNGFAVELPPHSIAVVTFSVNDEDNANGQKSEV